MNSFDKAFWDGLDGQFDETDVAEAVAAGSDYDIVPTGKYNVRVKEWEFKESRKKKTPGIEFIFEIMSGKSKGRLLWHTFYLTPKNMPYLFKDMYTITAFRFSKPSELRTYDFGSLPISVTVVHEDYDGKNYAKINNFLPVDNTISQVDDPNLAF